MTDENSIRIQGTKRELMTLIPQIVAMRELIESKDVGTIYAYHNDLESVKRIGKPKVSLFFLEDSNYNKKQPKKGITEGARRQEGLIGFRLMNESTQSFSEANARALGNKIKNTFGSDGGFVWNKGKTMYSYTDWENGYQFQLLCRNESEPKRIITTVLSLQGHTPNWKNFNIVKNDEEATKYPENSGTHVVMGEVLPLPQYRPLVDVRFQYAYVKLDGVIQPINLYARNNKRAKTLVY